MRRGRPWINVQDSAEASALATGYAALPTADGGVGRAGMVPLDAGCSGAEGGDMVAQTFRCGLRRAAARTETAVASDEQSPAGRPASSSLP